MEQLGPTGGILVKFGILEFIKNLPRKFKLHYNLPRTKDTLHEDRYTFLIIPRSVFLRMRNISDKSYRENQNPHFLFNIFFKKPVIYEIMWKL
jgi:hypothetical protein